MHRPRRHPFVLLLLIQAPLFSHAFLQPSFSPSSHHQQHQPRRSPKIINHATTSATTTTPTTTPTTPTTAPILPGTFDLDSWASLFRPVPSEEIEESIEYWLEDITGTIPPDLEGTYLSLGPVRIERAGQPCKHWLDGDGFITGISFHKGKAHVKTKVVQTEAYKEEKMRGAFSFVRGQFGSMKAGPTLTFPFRRDDQDHNNDATPFFSFSSSLPSPLFNAFDMSFKNPSNTKPLIWGSKENTRLLTCFEAALPYELDPHTLETRGEFNFKDLLKSGQAVTSAIPQIKAALEKGGKTGHAFTAHARVDAETQRLCGWSWKTMIGGMGNSNSADEEEENQPAAGVGSGGMEVTFYEFNDAFETAFPPLTIQVPNCAAPPHDWILTTNYYIWVKYALTLDLLPCLLGIKGPGECMKALQGPQTKAVIYVVPRPGGAYSGEAPTVIETEPYFLTHWSHAFEVKEVVVEGAHTHTDTQTSTHTNNNSKHQKSTKIVAYAAGWDKDLFLEANGDGNLFGEIYEGAPDFSRLPIIRLHRVEIDLESKTGVYKRVKSLQKTLVDFPKVHPAWEMKKEARHVYMMACNDVGENSPPQGFVHCDLLRGELVDGWYAGGGKEEEERRHVFVGEGVLAPKRGQGQGEGGEGDHKEEEEEVELACYWMGFEYDAKTGRRSLCIWDTRRGLAAGPICKIHLRKGHLLPWGIHAEFVPDLQLIEPL